MIELLFEYNIIEMLLAAVIAILSVFMTKTVVLKLYVSKTRDIDPYKNLSFMVFLSGMILSVCYLVFTIFDPLAATMQLLKAQNLSEFGIILEYLKYMLMFLVISYALSAAIIFITSSLFTVMTKNLDEYNEIAEGNVGVALLMVVLVLVISVFTQHPFLVFMETFIPFPDVPNILG